VHKFTFLPKAVCKCKQHLGPWKQQPFQLELGLSDGKAVNSRRVVTWAALLYKYLSHGQRVVWVMWMS